MIFRRGKARVRRTSMCWADLGLDGLIRELFDERVVVPEPVEVKPYSVRKLVPGVEADAKASKVKALFWSNSIRRRGFL